MNYAIASESTDWCVSYAPTDDATPLLKLAKVAGSILEAPSPSLVVVNRILDTSDQVRGQNETFVNVEVPVRLPKG